MEECVEEKRRKEGCEEEMGEEEEATAPEKVASFYTWAIGGASQNTYQTHLSSSSASCILAGPGAAQLATP